MNLFREIKRFLKLQELDGVCDVDKARVANRSDAGFSIMEIMIVVVIIGLVAAMAGPKFNREMTRMEFRGDARNVVSMLREARSLALTEKVDHGVYFDQTAATITLFRDEVSSTPPSFGSGDEVLRVDTVSGQYATIGHTFTAPVLFSPNGSASESGQVILLNYGLVEGDYYSTNYAILNVLAATGRSKLSEIHAY